MELIGTAIDQKLTAEDGSIRVSRRTVMLKEKPAHYDLKWFGIAQSV
jgi:hypothetical protein